VPRISETIPDTLDAVKAVDQGVLEAYVAEGFMLPNGRKDNAKIRQHIFEAVRSHKVLTLKERPHQAITRGAVTQEVFPSLTGPDGFADAQDPQLALAVWTKVSADVWSMLQPNVTSAVQQLVGAVMGNGYFLCRTKIGDDLNDAVYVTDSLPCIVADFLEPQAKAVQRKIDLEVANFTVLMQRHPSDAKALLGKFSKQLTGLKTGGMIQLEQAAEAALASLNGGSATEGDEPGDGEEV
jgi:hypothetical protein